MKENFAERLVAWHSRHGRHDLPWQNTRDPYRIWLSEIMLQQTQVETVIPYYRRFLAAFPQVTALAAAEQEQVMTLWSGLGYYARARNLHKAARVVATDYGGRFPDSAEALAALPGIGRSTAAAIAAFAFGERVAILDGNVKRVLCRLFGIEGFPGEKAVETRLWSLAESLLPKGEAQAEIAPYTQAQMDLGATVCTRGRPACPCCPFQDECVANRQGRWTELPHKRPRKALPQRHTLMAVVVSEGRVLLQRRPPSGIWGGLLSLPEFPCAATMRQWLGIFIVPDAEARPLAPLTHAFTHFVLDIEPWLIETGPLPVQVAEGGAGEYLLLPLAEAAQAALPAPIRRILREMQD